jgi:hypothetical protein
MADIQRRIDQNGWTAIYVGDYHSVPSWAYSVGFHSSLAAPEIIVFDVPQDVANNLFWEVYEELKSGQLALRDGERWRADQTETPLVWRKVHPSQLQNEETIWLGLAETFQLILRPQDMFEAFQLVLSDPQGRLPWEAGYDERLRERQPALWEPAELAADGPV